MDRVFKSRVSGFGSWTWTRNFIFCHFWWFFKVECTNPGYPKIGFQVPETWVLKVPWRNGFKAIWTRLFIIFCQILATWFFKVERTDDTAKLWKTLKCVKNLAKKWRKALFNLPSIHFLADSGYPKIGFRVSVPPLNTTTWIKIRKKPASIGSDITPINNIPLFFYSRSCQIIRKCFGIQFDFIQ